MGSQETEENGRMVSHNPGLLDQMYRPQRVEEARVGTSEKQREKRNVDGRWMGLGYTGKETGVGVRGSG